MKAGIGRVRRVAQALAVVTLAAFAMAEASLAAPPNDDLADAISPPLYLSSFGTLHASLGANNVDATTQGGEPLPCGSIGSTVWFIFDPPRSGTVFAHAAGSGGLDPVMAMYNTPSGTLIVCNDDYTVDGEAAGAEVFSAGQNPAPLLIQVGGFFGSEGSFDFTLDFQPATRLAALVTFITVTRRRSRISRFSIDTEAGATTRLRCLKVCGNFGQKTVTFSGAGDVNLRGLFNGNGFRLSGGAVLELFITKARQVGYYEKIKIRGRRRPPKRTSMCLDSTTSSAAGSLISCP